MRLVLLGALALAASGCAGPARGLALPKAGGPIPVSREHEPTAAERAYWDQLAAARVIYVAETHDRNSDHVYQWEVLKGLRVRHTSFTVAWEMFDVTQQPALDDWNQHRLSTDALLARTDFQRHWGTYSVMYEKILRWTQSEAIASLALNAPNSVSHKLAQGKPLEPAEQSLLPTGYEPLSGGYEHFTAQLGDSPHADANLENFYKAQTAWDQTMAARIVDFLGTHPDWKLVVLVGRGHVDGGFGVPAYVAQKTDAAQLVVYPGGVPDEAGHAASKVAASAGKSSDRTPGSVRS